MSIHWAEPGEKSVGEYQCSGIPFVTASTLLVGETRHIGFPRVTKFILVRNANTGTSTDTALAVGFTVNGVEANPASQTNYLTLYGGESLSADLRVKSLFLSNSLGGDQTWIEFEILAGLTDIAADQLFTITGSNGYKGVG